MYKIINFLIITTLTIYITACNVAYNDKEISEANNLLDQLNTEDKEYFKLIDLDNPNTYHNDDTGIYNNVILLYKNKAGE